MPNGVKDSIEPNAARHSHISLMSELGVSERINKRYHGHAGGDIQTRHYIKRYDKRLLAAARVAAEAIVECLGAL
jgi:intergrase/recombinase